VLVAVGAALRRQVRRPSLIDDYLLGVLTVRIRFPMMVPEARECDCW